mgnify:FL=1
MQNEDIPSGADSSEQNLNRAGAPGPTVTVPDGPYRIYTALSSSTPMVLTK